MNSAALSGNRKTDGLGANSEIGRKLKQYYDDLVSDEVPDKFLELLSRLDRSEKENPGKSAD